MRKGFKKVRIYLSQIPAYPAQKMKLSIKGFLVNLFLQFPVDLVTFTKEILNEKLHFLCSDKYIFCFEFSANLTF